ncbi:MAG: hypothetical protein ABR929_12460 [Roseiarcus sp.]|jgi:hypothetical protein
MSEGPAGRLASAHLAPLAAFVLAISFTAILALTGLVGRRGGEAALLLAIAAFTAQRLTTLRRFAAARRANLREVEAMRDAGRLVLSVDERGSALPARARRRAGISPIASKPKTPAASSTSGRARARRRSCRPASSPVPRRRPNSSNSCAHACRVALPRLRPVVRTPRSASGER